MIFVLPSNSMTTVIVSVKKIWGGCSTNMGHEKCIQDFDEEN